MFLPLRIDNRSRPFWLKRSKRILFALLGAAALFNLRNMMEMSQGRISRPPRELPSISKLSEPQPMLKPSEIETLPILKLREPRTISKSSETEPPPIAELSDFQPFLEPNEREPQSILKQILNEPQTLSKPSETDPQPNSKPSESQPISKHGKLLDMTKPSEAPSISKLSELQLISKPSEPQPISKLIEPPSTWKPSEAQSIIKLSESPSTSKVSELQSMSKLIDAPYVSNPKTPSFSKAKAPTIRMNEPPSISKPKVVVVGLIRSLGDIHNNTWQTLVDLSCRYQVAVHITAVTIEKSPYSSRFCAPVWIDLQDDILDRSALNGLDRPERLGVIRDAQRLRVQKLLFPIDQGSDHSRYSDSVVIYSDLDLAGVPTAVNTMKRVDLILSSSDIRPHVICALGTKIRKDDKPPYYSDFYYDSFATVALPDAFFYAKEDRRFPVEDPTISGMSHEDFTFFFRNLGKRHPNNLAPVRSCFSGMALYRASVWLTPSCQYSLYQHNNTQFLKDQPRDHKGELTIFRYASKFYKVPCEHVIFHDCLHRQVFPNMTLAATNDSSTSLKMDVVVDPAFETFWVWEPLLE